MSNNNKWYKSWFNTEYYHILYKNRSTIEAESFIKKLIKELKLKKIVLYLILLVEKVDIQFTLTNWVLK